MVHVAWSPEVAYPLQAPRHDRTYMSRSRETPAKGGRTSSLSGSAAIEAMVARTAPAVLELLGNGTPRARSAIITALANRHPREDVVRTLMRLTVIGQLSERQGKYSLASASEAEAGVHRPDLALENGGG